MMHRNTHQKTIDAAVKQARNAIQGTSGGGSVAASPAVPQRLTRGDKHAFMIGFDAIGDESAALFSDGRAYDFGY